MSGEAFNNKKYLEEQRAAFQKALDRDTESSVFLEFGGKPLSDHHAERVLPGYEADSKAEILRETVKLAEVVMVVNALDILLRPDGRTLRGRIRGDTQLFYDQETLRLLKDAHKRQIPINKVVMAVTPPQLSSENARRTDVFREELRRMDIQLLTHYEIKGYPDESAIEQQNPFDKNDRVRSESKNLVAVSPGGGSGKFGVLLSEIYHALVEGETPDYVKFETFPIFQLDANHALNLAFEAATADLRNKVIDLAQRAGEKRTSYDKDIENFRLLKKTFEMFGKSAALSHIKDPVDMGINQIIQGIVDMEQVIQASHAEVVRRIQRYRVEIAEGIERIETLNAAEEILGRFEALYRIRTSDPQ